MRAIFSFVLLFFSLFAQAGLFDKKVEFLPPEQAFVFSAEGQSANQLQLQWQIAEGYYLYKKELLIKAQNAELGEVALPAGEIHQDEFFGEVEIYQQQLNIAVPVQATQAGASLLVRYQGCTQGFCYPPQEQELELASLLDNSPHAQKTSEKTTALEAPTLLSEQESLASRLMNSKFASFSFFLLGIGLAFTPCVLPMLPLLSALVIGQGERPNTWRAFALSMIYVQGMALTYSLLGLLVVALGLPFQVALQSPYVLVVLSLLFVLLALSMFGCFSLQLPSSWQTKLHLYSQQQKSGAFGGVFVMGMLAGLVASPCTSAPLSGALLYVAQTGDLFNGGFTLYLLALGMGLPLVLITLFGNRILPKSGAWMEKVKIAFGFVMLALPIFLLGRVLGEIWEMRLWALLACSFLIWLSLQLPQQGVALLLRILLLVCAIMFAKPLQDWLWGAGSANKQNQENGTENAMALPNTSFQAIHNYAELENALANNQKPLVMLDLYADWCVACKEFEKYTFTDPKVQQAFQNMLLLQVDMSQNSPENKELMQKLKVLGLPTIVFFNAQGQEIAGSRVTGFMPAQEFFSWLQKVGAE